MVLRGIGSCRARWQLLQRPLVYEELAWRELIESLSWAKGEEAVYWA